MSPVWPVVGALVVLVLVVVRRQLTVATVRGTSMTPTFDNGTRVLAVRRRAYRPGDVIVFRVGRASRDLAWRIKRVAAIPGDPVPAWMPDADTRVPTDCVVVVGDNPHSQDSRHLGYVPMRRIAGHVVRVLTTFETPGTGARPRISSDRE